MTAWIFGFSGCIITILIGYIKFDLTLLSCLQCILASLTAGMISLLWTTRGASYPWIRKHLIPNPASTWFFFLLIYFLCMLTLAPVLRDTTILLWLTIPLIASTGFTIIIFGPIQDRYVNRIMGKVKIKTTDKVNKQHA